MQDVTQDLINNIRDNVIGEGQLFMTPFGKRPLTYADYTASGRSLKFIEDFIQDHVLPYYANTHSESSATGRQSTVFREQARHLIRKSLNTSDEDAVIFCGSGATAAIHKLIDILNLRLPANLDDRYDLSRLIPDQDRPVVFIGPYEHHSNELPWRESIVELVSIPFSKKGGIDLEKLEEALITYADRSLKIGSFSAASNVTGLLSDVQTISRLLHRHDALSFWDYAAAGPYVPIDVTGIQDDQGDSGLDALYISPHKFIGGPGTPGILTVKRRLLTNRVPAVPGGGTVSYVTPEKHTYLPAGERREEGGTPAIVESIRAGLVFQLKDAVGPENIEKLEHHMVQTVIKRWSQNPNIEILGDTEAPRTSIVSFQVIWKGKPLHYGFVVALLNDLFGIQVRGGCSCAGPYGHELLNLGQDYSDAIEQAVADGFPILKLGWVRLNFNYFIGTETFEYLMRAVELIAEYGWKLHNHYKYDRQSAIWVCRSGHVPACLDLNQISFESGAFSPPPKECLGGGRPLKDYLEIAEDILQQAEVREGDPVDALPDAIEQLRWFSLPKDAAPNA